MQPDTYRMLADRQDHYWWHRARREMAIGLLQRYGARSDGCWVELGCGPGGNLGIPSAFHSRLTVGIDVFPLAIELAKAKYNKAGFVQADVGITLPLASASCDVVMIFNVLYHQWITDESAVLSEVWRVLRPDGLCLLTEPAFSILRREMDTAAMARKRYRRSDLTRMCSEAGFQVLFASYFTSFGFPLLAAFNMARPLRRRIHPDRQCAPDMRPLPPALNELMYGLASVETTAIVHGLAMPFGTTVVCVAHRPRNTTAV